jgi:hypothetical protein
MNAKQITVTIPATARKGFGRDAQWTVTVSGVANGSGATMRDAKESAAEHFYALAMNAATMPAMVRDDDGAVWVFTAHGSGYMGSRIRPGAESASIGTTYGEGTPEQAAEYIVRYHPGAVRIG